MRVSNIHFLEPVCIFALEIKTSRGDPDTMGRFEIFSNRQYLLKSSPVQHVPNFEECTDGMNFTNPQINEKKGFFNKFFNNFDHFCILLLHIIASISQKGTTRILTFSRVLTMIKTVARPAQICISELRFLDYWSSKKPGEAKELIKDSSPTMAITSTSEEDRELSEYSSDKKSKLQRKEKKF